MYGNHIDPMDCEDDPALPEAPIDPPKTPKRRISTRKNQDVNYEAMNNGDQQVQQTRSRTILSETYKIGKDYDSICVKKEFSDNTTSTSVFHIINLYDGDKNALKAYNRFFNCNINEKDSASFAINCLIYFNHVKKRNESFDLLKDASRFSYPLEYRFMDNGVRSVMISKENNKKPSFTDMSS